jgi:hypothetical protein
LERRILSPSMKQLHKRIIATILFHDRALDPWCCWSPKEG